MVSIKFKVIGKPQPQGSTRAFIPKGWDRAIITSANKNLKPWRKEVYDAAKLAMNGKELETGPIMVQINFFFARPKSTKLSVFYKITKPDIDKLARGVLDSLTGTCFKDDSQVVFLQADKNFSDNKEEGAIIGVYSLQSK